MDKGWVEMESVVGEVVSAGWWVDGGWENSWASWVSRWFRTVVRAGLCLRHQDILICLHLASPRTCR